MKNLSTNFYQRLSYNLISIVLIFFILYTAKNILIPLTFSLIFALLLLSPTKFFQKLGLSKSLSALVCIVLGLFIISIIITFLSIQLASFSDSWPTLKQQIILNFNSFESWIKAKFHVSNSTFNQYTNEALNTALSASGNMIGGVATAASTIVFDFVLIVIFTFLFLVYRGVAFRFFAHTFYAYHQENIAMVIEKIHNVARDYISGLFIEMTIVAAMNAIGLYIVGSQYVWFLAVLTALLNLVPYVGIATAMVISVLITMAGGNTEQVLGVVAVLVIVHLIDSNLLMPKIVGSKVKLNPIISLLGVIVGETLWGIPGMFLAIPLIAMLKVLYDNIEPLNHWGILLGDEEKTAKKKRIPIFLQRRKGKIKLDKTQE
jgi:predicted PurR-regulated permease PerM